MQWWTNFLDWLSSDNGWRIVSGAVIPFIAILGAGIIAASIGRGSAKRVIALSDREVKASAVTALISAARKAAVWNTLPIPEQQHIDHLIGDADIRLRLLPVPGTALAADWASHEIIGMKRNAVSFSFQAEQSLLVFRDRLIEWQARPGRAKRLFKNDLDSWAYDSSLSEQELVHQQQVWAAAQVAKTGPIDTVSSAAVATPTVAAATISAPESKPFAQSRFSRPAAGPAAATEPAHEEPRTFEPIVSPAAIEPEPVAPIASPAVAEVESVEPILSRAAIEPELAEPEFVEPELVEPVLVDPELVEHEVSEPEFLRHENADHLPEIVVPEHEPQNELPELVEPAPEEPRDLSEASVFAPVGDEHRHDEHRHDDDHNHQREQHQHY
jgi:hypothetical protein